LFGQSHHMDCEFWSTAIRLTNWLFLHASVVLLFFLPTLREWSRYGKQRQAEPFSFTNLNSYTVSKRWFLCFYLIGFSWTLLLLSFGSAGFNTAFCAVRLNQFSSSHPLPACLFLIHTGRRALEEIRSILTQSKSGAMHLSGFLVGLTFYLFVPLALFACKKSRDGEIDFEMVSVGVALFAWGSFHQFRCHQILSELKVESANKRDNGSYGLPRGDWFYRLCCPHYFAEIMLYLGLVIVC